MYARVCELCVCIGKLCVYIWVCMRMGVYAYGCVCIGVCVYACM